MLAAAPAFAQRAVVKLIPTEGHKVEGVLTLEESEGTVHLMGTVEGLTPGKHGFHVHEFGDCTAPDAASAGGHFTAAGHPHGAPDADQGKRHSGDMGNIEADKSGKAKVHIMDSVMTLSGPESVIGRAVIVHEKEDDLVTQPTGNAGGRVACGVIGVAGPKK